jgi:hypothetical protein
METAGTSYLSYPWLCWWPPRGALKVQLYWKGFKKNVESSWLFLPKPTPEYSRPTGPVSQKLPMLYVYIHIFSIFLYHVFTHHNCIIILIISLTEYTAATLRSRSMRYKNQNRNKKYHNIENPSWDQDDAIDDIKPKIYAVEF